MAVIFEKKDRNVIPNFRSLQSTITLGELDSEFALQQNHVEVSDDQAIEEWENKKNIGVAADLLNVSIVANNLSTSQVKEAAEFILKNSQDSSTLLIKEAQKILGKVASEGHRPNIHRIKEFLEMQNTTLLGSRIREIKDSIKRLVRNPFPYIELARIYSIIGLKEQALKNIQIAVALAPTNRYVVRSYVRLMTHYDETNKALQVLRKNGMLDDPWILSSEIALTTLNGGVSRFVKKDYRILSLITLYPLVKRN